MASPSEEEIAQLWAIHNSDERRRELLLRSYGFDSTRSWVDPNGYTLSTRVWRARRAIYDQIDAVLRDAIARGTDALEVADILEQFLAPELSPVRNALGRLIRNQKPVIVTRAPGRGGMGSFSARRLARTEITRAHGMATIEVAKRTPFAVGVKWSLSGRHPKSDPCDENAHRNSGLGPGVYKPEDVPSYPQHVMCLCTLSTATEDDVDSVVERLREQYDLSQPEPLAADEVSARLDAAAFSNDEAATAWREKSFPNSGLPYTDDEIDAIYVYGSSEYRNINGYLRNGPDSIRQELLAEIPEPTSLDAPQVPNPKLRAKFEAQAKIEKEAWWARKRAEVDEQVEQYGKYIADLDAAMTKTTVPRDVTAWRSINIKQYGDIDRLPGSVIQDQAFTSTTLRTDVRDKFSQTTTNHGETPAHVRVLIPKGSNVVSVDATKDSMFEEELVLPRGSRFRVVSVDRPTGQPPVITVELLP